MRLSTAVPAPLQITTTPNIAASYNSTGTLGASNVETFAIGDKLNVASKLNKNAYLTELNMRFGGGFSGVISGLALSIGTGLSVSIAAGYAYVRSIVEKLTSTTYTVPANQANIYIWLKNDGTFTHTLTTTAPDTTSLYIGACSTNATNVLEVDTAGVVYVRNGAAYREVGDTGVPAATAPNMRIYTKTSGGLFLSVNNTYGYSPVYNNTDDLNRIKDTVGNMFSSTTNVGFSYDPVNRTVTASFSLSGSSTDALGEGITNLYHTTARVISAIASTHVTYNTTQITATAAISLTTASPNIVAVDANGSTRDVNLPAVIGLGNWFRILNIGTANNLVLKAGTVTVATITPGQIVNATPKGSGGVISWPNTIAPE